MIPSVLFVFLLIVFVTDLVKTKIPNIYTIPSVLIGLLYYLFQDGWHGFLFSLSGCFVGFILLVLLYIFRAVGAGDVKLFAAIGALTGISFTLYTLMYAIFYAGMIGIVVIFMRRPSLFKWKERIYAFVCTVIFREKRYLQQASSPVTHFPFMLAVMPAALTVLWVFELK